MLRDIILGFAGEEGTETWSHRTSPWDVMGGRVFVHPGAEEAEAAETLVDEQHGDEAVLQSLLWWVIGIHAEGLEVLRSENHRRALVLVPGVRAPIIRGGGDSGCLRPLRSPGRCCGSVTKVAPLDCTGGPRSFGGGRGQSHRAPTWRLLLMRPGTDRARSPIRAAEVGTLLGLPSIHQEFLTRLLDILVAGEDPVGTAMVSAARPAPRGVR
jgi:hypothetical protein